LYKQLISLIIDQSVLFFVAIALICANSDLTQKLRRAVLITAQISVAAGLQHLVQTDDHLHEAEAELQRRAVQKTNQRLFHNS